MTYEMGVRENRMAHEYKNTATGEFEVVRQHGTYDVLESFLTPKGQILVLAHDDSAVEPYVVGIYNSHGVHWTDPDDARRFYGWQIAESFGLVVDKEGSKAVVPASREYATDLVKKIKQDCAEWHSGDVDAEVAGDRLAEHASSLGKHLQWIGVLAAPVFESWEVVG
ncbi:hypothetical protein [Streptomyces sp. NBC_00439]|uniref:hypothetical protein n=1 Tax=Streptomyces sp. NBC_00439 TaxID=2903650 RepID=UPI0022551C8C|nr:hypothetical protein [Streptomyces sp. NBC_00439]MCX5103477.1 hypothetical protein [Streptomyces sp. NBC_00439]